MRAADCMQNSGLFCFCNPQLLMAMKTYECVICGFVYDEAKGLPDEGIAPGTKWEDVPDTWLCPDCGVGKSDFEMVAI
jgi:rubredoxin